MYSSLIPILTGGSEVNISSALSDASTVVTWVITQVTSNAVILAAFTMGILVPAGVKAFKRIAKVGK